MRGGSSRRSYKINSCFDALVRCLECQASRAMVIKTIQGGNVRRQGRDHLSVHAMRSRNVEGCRIGRFAPSPFSAFAPIGISDSEM